MIPIGLILIVLLVSVKSADGLADGASSESDCYTIGVHVTDNKAESGL